MSMRTIFEINHDCGREIKDDPEGFVRDLLRYIGGGDSEAATRLERFGLRRAWWGHHSDDRKVVTKFSEYKL